MQSSLLNQLSKVVSFSPQLITILQKIKKSLVLKWSSSFQKQMQHHIVSLTCQNKNLLHYKYLQDKSNNQKSLTLILQILQTQININRQSRSHIVSLFLSHIFSHTSCYVSYSTFYLLVLNKPELLDQISHEKLVDINKKLEKQQNQNQLKQLFNIKISESQVFNIKKLGYCQQNLNSYLSQKVKPISNKTQKLTTSNLNLTKIPPLILPTSKSINSSRYSALSKEEKRKGILDLRKLASNLGQGFICVQLGCLLSNKRTQQVQQFSQNYSFRQKCLDKLDQIETQRMNSSRLSFSKQQFYQKQSQIQQNSKRYYRKVLILNLNLIMKKIEKTQNIQISIIKKHKGFFNQNELKQKECVKQLIDMNLLGIIQLPSNKSFEQKHNTIIKNNEDNNIFSFIKKQIKDIDYVVQWLMKRISLQSQKIHLNLLKNKNKIQSSYNFDIQTQQIIINDCMLGHINITRNQAKKVQGNWNIDQKTIYQIKKHSDAILLHIGGWLQSLFKSSNLDHPKFLFYQVNLLKVLNFYLSTCQSKVTPYIVVQFLFPLLIIIKRQITQLSHPYIQNPQYQYTNRTRQIPLIIKNKSLMQNYIDILTAILVNNKYVYKLFCNVFLKNVYFMDLVEHYLQVMFEQQNYNQVISVLKFYTKILDIFNQRKNKQNQSIIRNVVLQISSFMCPINGCISKALVKYQNILSPSQLDIQERNDYPNPIYNFLHQIFVFVSHVYYICQGQNIQSNCVLEQEVASFYIKYGFMNFIKLYSLMTVKQLVNINSSNEDMMTTKQSPHSLPKISSKKVFMIDFLKMLTNISINRTNTVSKKFLQYRVLQFFVRQLQLQFSISQNIQKYIKRPHNIIQPNQKIKTQTTQYHTKTIQNHTKTNQNHTKNKKPKVTPLNLNLTGQFFKKQQHKQQQKKFNSTHQPKGKKLVPPLNIPLKTQQRQKLIPPLNIPLKTQQRQNTISKDKQSGDRKGALDDLLSEITQSQKKKKSFVGQLNLQLSQLKGNSQKQKRKESSQKNLIYSTQRKIRKIYSNKTLHSESILLVFSLLLIRGQLDPLYCDQFPIDQGKMNVLYILHYHLNHSSNKSIIPILSEGVTKIKPYLAGQRLLKLLYNSFTDLKYYQNWSKISTGGYGVIYSATTQLYQPKQVAIKEMNFPKSISKRCVLHNIFTQISSLQLFRLDNSVTRMYNYGVIDNTYFIIMKKYTCSLKDWRQGNKISPVMDSFPVNLPNILSLYYDILKIIKLLHDQNVIHYDIKADNIMLQIVPSQNQYDKPFVQVAFGDFGQAKIFNNQTDQLDLKSRGTQCIKSPQMLTLALKNKKQADNYDRRKKIGTTRASDIWSLGCLLYQMITGQYLFHRNDWANFYMHVISPNQQLLTSQNYEKMNNNIYLIDFLKYILIRDPSHRPSIDNIINRFQNLYSLLVNNEQKVTQQNISMQYLKNTQNLINEYIEIINTAQKKKIKTQSFQKSVTKPTSKMLKIMQDIYFSQTHIDQDKLKQQNITHIITTQNLLKYQHFHIFFIDFNQQLSYNIAYKLCPRVSDFLRQVLLLKGKLLFINNQTNYAINLLVFTLSYWFRCSAYQTWCLINTQLLSFPTFTFDLVRMSKILNKLNLIQKQYQRFPKLQCICGSVTIMMKKCPDKKNDYQICKCKKKSQIANCSSSGCAKYVQHLKKRYNISWQYLKWALINPSYLLTPIKSNNKQQSIRTQILLNSAQPISNMISTVIDANGWTLYECKMCQMWIMATKNNQIRIILNNLIKSVRQGIMIPNAQQGFKARTPSLNYYTLSKLHMTSQ